MRAIRVTAARLLSRTEDLGTEMGLPSHRLRQYRVEDVPSPPSWSGGVAPVSSEARTAHYRPQGNRCTRLDPCPICLAKGVVPAAAPPPREPWTADSSHPWDGVHVRPNDVAAIPGAHWYTKSTPNSITYVMEFAGWIPWWRPFLYGAAFLLLLWACMAWETWIGYFTW